MNRLVKVPIALSLVAMGLLSLRLQMGWLFWGLFVETLQRLAARDPFSFVTAVIGILGGLSIAIGESAIWIHECRGTDRTEADSQ